MSSQRPLRVGYLVQHFLPETGALPARAAELALRWKAAGAKVTIYTSMPHRPAGKIHPDYRGRLFINEDWEGIEVRRSWIFATARHGLAKTLVNNASFMITSMFGALRHHAPDVLIASAPAFFTHISGVVLGLSRRTPLVLEIRDLWPDYIVGMGVLKPGLTTRALFGLEKFLLRRAGRVVVVTESFKRRVATKGVGLDRIDVIPNGVDLDQYYPSTEPAPHELLSRNGKNFIVGYLGNFGSGQNLLSIVDAAVILQRSEPSIRIILAGDGPERAKVVSHAAEVGATNLFLLPSFPKNATRAFYNSCDVCLVPLAPFPILQETVPSKIFEIMACGRPVLASLSGEGAEIINRSGAGLTAEPGNPVAIAAAVLRLHSMSEPERTTMGAAGREYVGANYNRDILARKYLELLSAVAAQSPGSSN